MVIKLEVRTAEGRRVFNVTLSDYLNARTFQRNVRTIRADDVFYYGGLCTSDGCKPTPKPLEIGGGHSRVEQYSACQALVQ